MARPANPTATIRKTAEMIRTSDVASFFTRIWDGVDEENVSSPVILSEAVWVGVSERISKAQTVAQAMFFVVRDPYAHTRPPTSLRMTGQWWLRTSGRLY